MKKKMDALESRPGARGVFWSDLESRFEGLLLSWQNLRLDSGMQYRIWIGTSKDHALNNGFIELMIQSFGNEFMPIENGEVENRLLLLWNVYINDPEKQSVNILTSDLFRAIKIGKVLETHSRVVTSALSEFEASLASKSIRLVDSHIQRYSTLDLPEQILSEKIKNQINYDARSAILLAKMYCKMAESGDTKLAKRTANLLGIDVALVHSAVKIARRNGWMTPAIPGKAGGTMTILGEEELTRTNQNKIFHEIMSDLGGR